MKLPIGRCGSLSPEAEVGEDRLMEVVLEARESISLTLQHPGDGDTRPCGHDLGHVLRRDLFLEKATCLLDSDQFLFRGSQRFPVAGHLPVRDLGCRLQIPCPGGLFGGKGRLFQPFLQFAYPVDRRLLSQPAPLEPGQLLPHPGEVRLECLAPRLGFRIILG